MSHDMGGFREILAPDSFREVTVNPPNDVPFVMNHNNATSMANTGAGSMVLRSDQVGLYMDAIAPEALEDTRQLVIRM